MKPMNLMLGALALGWLAAEARAVDSPYAGAPRSVVAAPSAPATPAAPTFHYASESGGSCCDTYGDCCGPCRFYAGAGIYYIQPRFESDPAIVAFFSSAFSEANLGLEGTGLGASVFPNIATELSFAYDYEVAPRVWIGAVNDCGCGVRARYWGIDQDATKFIDLFGIQIGNILRLQVPQPVPPPPAPVFEQFEFSFSESSFVGARSDLELDVFDLELTYEAECCGWWVFSAGVRYANVDQFYGGRLNATLISAEFVGEQVINLLTVTQDESLSVDDEFDALGPTASVEYKCPLGCFNLWLYGNARLSYLIGHGETKVARSLFREQTSDIALTLEQTFEGSGSTLHDRDDKYWVGELELGLECTKDCQGVLVFGRVGFVAQTWWDYTLPTSFILGDTGIFQGFESLETRNSSQEETDLNFFGVTAVAGFRF